MKYFIIEYFQSSCNKWTRHTLTEYETYKEAKSEVESYKEHELGLKFRILKVEEIKE